MSDDTLTRSHGDLATTWAQRITDWLAPLHVVVGLLLVVSARSSSSVVEGLGWAVLAAIFCGAVPWGVVELGVRAGRWSDRQIDDRRDRPLPMTAALAALIAGAVLLHWLEAPGTVQDLVVKMTSGLVAVLAVTLVWKISVHVGVVAGAAVVLSQTDLRFVVPAVVAVVLVAWSRVRLGRHSRWQVLAGAAVGAGVALLGPGSIA